jgi:HK97 family phage major capsid protein
MSGYKELQQERADLVAEGRKLFEAAEAEKRDLTAEETARDDAINARLDGIAAQLEREERRRERERMVEAVGTGVTLPGRITGIRDLAADRPWGPDAVSGFGAFLHAVAQAGTPGGRMDPRLFAGPMGASEGVPSDGGFLVRHEFNTMLLDRALEESLLAPLCTPIEVGEDADGVDMPYIKETSRATGSRWGGVQVYRRAEADTVTATKPEFGMLDVRLEDMMGLAYATNRLLRDARAMGSIFSIAFSSEFAFKLDDEIFRGNGAGQCLGIIDATGPRVRQDAEDGQAADSIVHQNISKMWARVRPRSKPRGVWLINSEVTPQLDELAVIAGTGALEQRVVRYGEDGVLRIKGRPVMEIEQASALGDEGDIVYADFKEYGLIRKGGIEAATSMHVRFVYAEMAFRWMYAVIGRPLMTSAITPYKGTATQSAFVTLEAR